MTSLLLLCPLSSLRFHHILFRFLFFSSRIFLNACQFRCSLTKSSDCTEPWAPCRRSPAQLCPALLMLYFCTVPHSPQFQRLFQTWHGVRGLTQLRWDAACRVLCAWKSKANNLLATPASSAGWSAFLRYWELQPIRSRSTLPSPARSSLARTLTHRRSTCCFRADYAAVHLLRSLTFSAAVCCPKGSSPPAGRTALSRRHLLDSCLTSFFLVWDIVSCCFFPLLRWGNPSQKPFRPRCPAASFRSDRLGVGNDASVVQRCGTRRGGPGAVRLRAVPPPAGRGRRAHGEEGLEAGRRGWKPRGCALRTAGKQRRVSRCALGGSGGGGRARAERRPPYGGASGPGGARALGSGQCRAAGTLRSPLGPFPLLWPRAARRRQPLLPPRPRCSGTGARGTAAGAAGRLLPPAGRSALGRAAGRAAGRGGSARRETPAVCGARGCAAAGNRRSAAGRPGARRGSVSLKARHEYFPDGNDFSLRVPWGLL